MHSVEYLGRGAGEPSIGNNWKTGVTSFQSDLQTLFVTFNDTAHTATWVNRAAPTSQAVDSDPIGFTDPQTGRTFAGELTLLSPDTCKTSYTDDDGTSSGSADPAIAIDASGRAYFAIANNDNSIAVGTSDNQGQTGTTSSMLVVHTA